ncbi:MAG: Adenylate cyclase [Labilithrix sp.]|nr:Adenylate cyclase [Labilithrix sp.]
MTSFGRLGVACGAALAVAAWTIACSTFSADPEPAPPPDSGADAFETGVPSIDSGARDGGALDADAGPDATPPGMIRVPIPSGGSFFIDATEVTVTAFAKVKAETPMFPALDPGICGGKTGWGPPVASECDAETGAEQPRNCVDWCDAQAYCKAVGKRLCGGYHGASLSQADEFTDPIADQWSRACRGSANTDWPYGTTFIRYRCNTELDAGPLRVGAFANCEGGWPGLLDMSGNVAEWEDYCSDSNTDGKRDCLVRGGGYNSPPDDTGCIYGRSVTALTAAPDIGFRCCLDAD